MESAEDYLIHAHFKQAREQKDVLFHVAQSLGMLGKNDEAALLVAAAKEPLPDPVADLDWNTYLDGTWYFLKHDRDGLKHSELKLGQEAGTGNNLNHNVLVGLLYCFDKSYEIAYGEACRTQMTVDEPAQPRKE